MRHRHDAARFSSWAGCGSLGGRHDRPFAPSSGEEDPACFVADLVQPILLRCRRRPLPQPRRSPSAAPPAPRRRWWSPSDHGRRRGAPCSNEPKGPDTASPELPVLRSCSGMSLEVRAASARCRRVLESGGVRGDDGGSRGRPFAPSSGEEEPSGSRADGRVIAGLGRPLLLRCRRRPLPQLPRSLPRRRPPRTGVGGRPATKDAAEGPSSRASRSCPGPCVELCSGTGLEVRAASARWRRVLELGGVRGARRETRRAIRPVLRRRRAVREQGRRADGRRNRKAHSSPLPAPTAAAAPSKVPRGAAGPASALVVAERPRTPPRGTLPEPAEPSPRDGGQADRPIRP